MKRNKKKKLYRSQFARFVSAVYQLQILSSKVCTIL